MRSSEIEALARNELERASLPILLKPVLIDLQADPPAQRFVVDRLIPRGVVTLLGAHGGAGKSLLAEELAAHCATGTIWCGFGIERGRALFVSLEDAPGTLAFRLRRIVDAYGLRESDLLANLTIVDGSDTDSALAIETSEFGPSRLIQTAAMEELQEVANGYDLIVIDNASDAFAGNENHRRQVRAFMRMLAGIARANDAGVLLLAHIDKNAAKFGGSGNNYSGSTAWHNSARSRLTLIENKGLVELRQEKAQFGKLADPVFLTWSSTGVLVPAESRPKQDDHATEQADADDDAGLLAAIRAAAAAEVQVSDSRSGPATAQRTLATFADLPKELRGSKGRERFWHAMGRLKQAGKIVIEDRYSASRNLRRCILPLEGSSVSCVRLSPHTPHAVNRETHEGVPGSAGFVDSRELTQTHETHEAECTADEYRAARGGK